MTRAGFDLLEVAERYGDACVEYESRLKNWRRERSGTGFGCGSWVDVSMETVIVRDTASVWTLCSRRKAEFTFQSGDVRLSSSEVRSRYPIASFNAARISTILPAPKFGR